MASTVEHCFYWWFVESLEQLIYRQKFFFWFCAVVVVISNSKNPDIFIRLPCSTKETHIRSDWFNTIWLNENVLLNVKDWLHYVAYFQSPPRIYKRLELRRIRDVQRVKADFIILYFTKNTVTYLSSNEHPVYICKNHVIFKQHLVNTICILARSLFHKNLGKISSKM